MLSVERYFDRSKLRKIAYVSVSSGSTTTVFLRNYRTRFSVQVPNAQAFYY